MPASTVTCSTEENSFGCLHQVGYCLSSVGKYEEARGWFKRAVEEAQKGDVHGRVDHESLGSSLHHVGYCLWIVGKYEAKGWFKRGVEEKEKGDMHGRIDNESLGRSLHQMGHCLGSVGKYEEASDWFERAVEESEKGDVHGRVNTRASLSLYALVLSTSGIWAESTRPKPVKRELARSLLGCSI
jgi:tetratricopeptide (TPR) repeat protein